MSAAPDAFASATSARRRGVMVALALAVVAISAASLSMGAVTISPSEVVSVVTRRLGVSLFSEPSTQADAVLWGIRLPRVLLGLVVGGALGLAGSALQGVFRNPLADPQLLALGPGASLGAVVFLLVLDPGPGAAVAGASVGAVATAAAVRRFADDADPDPSRLVLIGVALGLVLSAWVGFVVFAADRAAVPPVDFWLLGSLARATWRMVANAAVVALLGALFLAGGTRSLDVLSLGEAEARHLGVDVELTTRMVLLGTALTVGAAVGAAGVVGFVGLLVPHVIRRWIGPGHRTLLAGSVLGGAALVAGADLAGRTLASPIEIPVGLVTTVAGGPFFLWLLARSRRRESP